MESRGKRPYRCWLLLPAVLAAAVLLWQLALMGTAAGKERKLFRLLVQREEGLTEELLEGLSSLPGVESAFSGIRLEGQLTIGDYSGPVTVWGVDLERYPMELVSSAGPAAVGGNPALVIGRDVLSRFTGRDGRTATGARVKQMEDSYKELPASLRLDIWEGNGLLGEAGYGAGDSFVGGVSAAGDGKKHQESAAREGAEPGEAYSGGSTLAETGAAGGRPAIILGLAAGADCYMDQEQARAFFRESGESFQVSQVCLTVRGEKFAENVEKAAAEAGLRVEKQEQKEK